jgi:hypothetical protein
MAAVTVNRRRSIITGSKRGILADVSVAANGDTFDTKLKIIDGVSADSSSTAAIGLTIAAGVITFVTAGAITHTQVIAHGT